MSISLSCPACHTRLKAPDGAAGRSIKCPKCQGSIPVPAAVTAPAPAPITARVDAPPPRRGCLTGCLVVCLLLSVALNLAFVGGFLALGFTGSFDTLARTWNRLPWAGTARETAARLSVQNLEAAVTAYKVSEGDWPADLAALTQPGDGRPAAVDPGQLLDPWGRPYGYDLAGPHNGGARPDIWSEGPRPGDAASVIGNWKVDGGAQAKTEGPPPSPRAAPAAAPTPDPELKWAQGIAEEFLGHVIAGRNQQALALATPEFQRQHGDLDVGYTVQGGGVLRHESWSIDSADLSPGRDEAVFKGILRHPSSSFQSKDTLFTLRMVKEKSSGKWKVEGLNLRDAS